MRCSGVSSHRVKVRVITVTAADCKIELFDKDHYTSYVETARSCLKVSLLHTAAIPISVWLTWRNSPSGPNDQTG